MCWSWLLFNCGGCLLRMLLLRLTAFSILLVCVSCLDFFSDSRWCIGLCRILCTVLCGFTVLMEFWNTIWILRWNVLCWVWLSFVSGLLCQLIFFCEGDFKFISSCVRVFFLQLLCFSRVTVLLFFRVREMLFSTVWCWCFLLNLLWV